MFRRMALALLDLAEFRLLRALRAGTGAAFIQLWNAHAGAVWTVFRALVDHDREALGWMASFRLDLQGRTTQFRADEGVSQQVGHALYDHACASFSEVAPLPEGPQPPDETGVRHLPPSARLGYLVDLFFDWTPPDDTIVAAYRLLEPAADTDARLVVHTALLRNPPAEAFILPPGGLPSSDLPPRWHRTGLILGIAGGIMLAGVVASVWRTAPPDPGWLHREALSASGGVMVDSDAGRLARRLDAAGVPSSLVECPPLTGAALKLIGARYEGEVVVLLYRGLSTDWTLQHRAYGDLPGEDAGNGLSTGMIAELAHGSWRDEGGVWTLVARVDSVTLQTTARLVMAERDHPPAPIDGEGGLRLPQLPPSALPFPRPKEP